MKQCIKCEDDFYAKELCKKHYKQSLGESGGYKKEYAKRKLNPEYLKMRVESNKKYRQRMKETGVSSVKNKILWETFSSNPEYIKEKNYRHRLYHQKHKNDPDYKNRKKLQLRKYRLNLRKKVLSFYSPKLECVSCGFNDERALVVDHVENNGMIHKKTINKSGHVSPAQVYADIIKNKYPLGYQVLCWNCNYIKEYERRIRG